MLENINIKINKGEFLAIVGPNGAGKSTLLKLILGLLPLQSGEIFVEGIDFKNKKTSIKLSYVSQKANAFNSGFPASVKEVVLSGLTKTKRLFQTFNSKDNEKVIKVLERLNISDLIHKNIAELSGGQQQRVMIARALISEPAVLVLDEPTNGIDAKHVSEFYNTLDQLKQEGITIILVTHDIGVVADTATEVACLISICISMVQLMSLNHLMKLKFQKFMDILYVLSIISIIENVVINKDLSLFKMERRVTIDRCIIEF